MSYYKMLVVTSIRKNLFWYRLIFLFCHLFSFQIMTLQNVQFSSDKSVPRSLVGRRHSMPADSFVHDKNFGPSDRQLDSLALNHLPPPPPRRRIQTDLTVPRAKLQSLAEMYNRKFGPFEEPRVCPGDLKQVDICHMCHDIIVPNIDHECLRIRQAVEEAATKPRRPGDSRPLFYPKEPKVEESDAADEALSVLLQKARDAGATL